MIKVKAIVCPMCGDTIYSRARHDCRHCSCESTFIDGGFDYTRVSSKYPNKVKTKTIKIKATKKELYDDWNNFTDKYGLIEGLRIKDVEKMLDEEIKRGLKSGKPEPVYKDPKPNLKKIDNIDKMFEDIDKKRREHPIYYFFHDLYYRVKNYITEIPGRIKVFIQRGERGYSYFDVWGFDSYLAKVIAEGLKHLKKHGTSLPTWKEGKSETQARKEWNQILNTIIKTFEIAQKIVNADLIYIPSKDFDWKVYKSWKRSVQDINKKHKNNDIRVMTKRESLEYERGFDLFKEWFLALWD